MIRWKNYYLVIIMMFLGLLISIYLGSKDLKFQSQLIEIKKESIINIHVEEAYNERGIYILNNKYFIQGAAYVLGSDDGLAEDKAIWRPNSEKYYPKISDIKPPFTISKNRNSDTIFVEKYGSKISLLLSN
ncbi:hypothetical protein [Confluentibacter flavum]|uniref:Uncharacterized protein n=1 Tax=Confluentibacter flavum TaxID=1909700 RepID=A0A2N3HJP6_9FLAO|nr:hypothetical protein [Confluentibacter flavum]PKQ45186.1 hypothetical protein CSW08_09210 [Confluentibacter flavum]